MPAHFYTVFGRRFEPAIRCAIVQSRPITSFIQAADWEFVGTVRPSEPPPVGFRHDRACRISRAKKKHVQGLSTHDVHSLLPQQHSAKADAISGWQTLGFPWQQSWTKNASSLRVPLTSTL